MLNPLFTKLANRIGELEVHNLALQADLEAAQEQIAGLTADLDQTREELTAPDAPVQDFTSD